MYISYIFDWLYQSMQLRLPIVLGPNLFFSLTIFQFFIGFCYLFISFILIKFFLFGVLDYKVENNKFSHDEALAIQDSRRKTKNTYNDSIAGRILSNKNAGRISVDNIHNDSIGGRILSNKKDKR